MKFDATYTTPDRFDAAEFARINELCGRATKTLSDLYHEHVESVFGAAICAVCGDMPTAERLREMGHIYIMPDGTKFLTWGSRDNVIAAVPPPTIYTPCSPSR